ncbi:hypothetical protein NX059_005380 [Plenodomus lindquistii]|nr:hypothetical protein NX059_005380 [Plenodomus lindquistii]
MAAGSGEIAEELKGTLGEKLMSRDEGSRVVVNFHGNAGHIAQSTRPNTYRSLSSIPKTHTLTCSYRGFGSSTLLNAPHLPTEKGLITDAISLLTYLHTDLAHPKRRTVLLGQSLGTAVASAASLWSVDPTSQYLPSDLPALSNPSISTTTTTNQPSDTYASIILVSAFRNLPDLLKTYRIGGIIPILKPLSGYPRIANWINGRILDTWPTLPRLLALVAAHTRDQNNPAAGLNIHLIHARNDQDITFRESEAVYAPLQSALLALEGASASEERRSILGGERVKRGAFAYRKVETEGGGVSVELEVVRFGGHNEVVGWSAVGLGVRRAFARVEKGDRA